MSADRSYECLTKYLYFISLRLYLSPFMYWCASNLFLLYFMLIFMLNYVMKGCMRRQEGSSSQCLSVATNSYIDLRMFWQCNYSRVGSRLHHDVIINP